MFRFAEQDTKAFKRKILNACRIRHCENGTRQKKGGRGAAL
jgi:hypothetical protein